MQTKNVYDLNSLLPHNYVRAQFLAFFYSCQEKNEEKKDTKQKKKKKKKKRKVGQKHHKKSIQAFHMAHFLKNRSILHSIFAKCMWDKPFFFFCLRFKDLILCTENSVWLNKQV